MRNFRGSKRLRRGSVTLKDGIGLVFPQNTSVEKERPADSRQIEAKQNEVVTVKTVPVRLGSRSYEIEIGTNLLGRVVKRLACLAAGRQVVVVTDENVSSTYADPLLASLRESGFTPLLAVVPPGESSKSLSIASGLFDQMIHSNADRRTVVIALGGGVVGDLAGFVAATYARGVSFYQIPTTLLAMVDSSVGGKVGIDHPLAKNMIGAFHQPIGVTCDIDLLASLPDRQYRCGLAEVVKYGVIMDPIFFEMIETSIDAINQRDPLVVATMVAKCCELKAQVVEEDEFETTGRRAILNYGHTFAHAFETAADYEKVQHGEAVAMGMICAARLAERLGRIDGQINHRQRALWKSLQLPTVVPSWLLEEDLIASMRKDKKSLAGRLRFVLPTRLGHVSIVEDVDESLVQEVMRECSQSP
jgi:3-dehydroquinate synthase